MRVDDSAVAVFLCPPPSAASLTTAVFRVPAMSSEDEADVVDDDVESGKDSEVVDPPRGGD